GGDLSGDGLLIDRTARHRRHRDGGRRRGRQRARWSDLTANGGLLVQLQTAHLVGRGFHADNFGAAPKRDGVLALIPGPHLAGESLSGSLSSDGRGSGGATGQRDKCERTESEPNHGVHAAGPPTSVVPTT